MFPRGNRTARAVVRLTACLLVAAGSGCGVNPFRARAPEGPLLDPVKVSDLRPGCYCEIDMVVPPVGTNESFDCFKGTVKEINHDEIVLTNALEETCIDYGANSRPRQPTQQKRDIVSVPLTGIDTIWAFPPAKNDPVMKPATTMSAPKLPSGGAEPKLPPSAPIATAEDPGNQPEAGRSSPSLADTPAHFDAPPATNNMVR